MARILNKNIIKTAVISTIMLVIVIAYFISINIDANIETHQLSNINIKFILDSCNTVFTKYKIYLPKYRGEESLYEMEELSKMRPYAIVDNSIGEFTIPVNLVTGETYIYLVDNTVPDYSTYKYIPLKVKNLKNDTSLKINLLNEIEIVIKSNNAKANLLNSEIRIVNTLNGYSYSAVYKDQLKFKFPIRKGEIAFYRLLYKDSIVKLDTFRCDCKLYRIINYAI